MSGFQMVGTTDLQNVRFFNDSGNRMSGFWIPTVIAFYFFTVNAACPDTHGRKEVHLRGV